MEISLATAAVPESDSTFTGGRSPARRSNQACRVLRLDEYRADADVPAFFRLAQVGLRRTAPAVGRPTFAGGPAVSSSKSRQVKPQVRSVLVVDDDLSAIETFSRMLQREGYNVRTALDAEKGLREAEAMPVDAILLDLRMPLVDGLAFLRQFRQREAGRRTPVAIVTGDYFLDDEVREELGALGAEVYFKPLWLEDLVIITERLVENKTTSQAMRAAPLADARSHALTPASRS